LAALCAVTSRRKRHVNAFFLIDHGLGDGMSVPLAQVTADPAAQWMNLDELKRLALSGGCTSAEFARAAEMFGNHPFRVARYLKRHSFVPLTFTIPLGGHFGADESQVD
jgi:hypothetical protein